METEYVKVGVLAPGTVAANTNIALPGYFGKVAKLVAAILFTGSDGTAAAAATNLTVVDTTPAAGEIQLVDESTIQLGDATDAKNLLVLIYISKGSVSGY